MHPYRGRVGARRHDLDRDALDAFKQTFSPSEYAALRKFAGTKTGQDVLAKMPTLYGRLAVVGDRYASDALSEGDSKK